MDKANALILLEHAGAILDSLIADIPAERLTMSFGPTIWTIQENINHLVMVQISNLKRIDLFITQPYPEIVPFIPGKSDKQPELKPIPELAALFKDWRAKQIEAIDQADDSVWTKRAKHPEYADYTFAFMVRHLILHDYFHFYRIEELGFSKPEKIKPV